MEYSYYSIKDHANDRRYSKKKNKPKDIGREKRGYRAHRNHTPSNTSFRVKITREIKSIEKK